MTKIMAASFLLCGLGAFSQQPKTMTKVVVQLDSPDVPKDSFAAKPKAMYRAGSRYCRIEEQPDPGRNIHGLVIINEPDAWMVNLASGTAQHIVDPGPSLNCRLAIFANLASSLPDDESKSITPIEFGFEIEFFKAKGASPQPGPVLQTKQTTAYKLQFGESAVALFTYGDPERPLAVGWTRRERHEIFWYSGYGQMDFDPKLFAKPENVKIEEVK